MRSRRVRSLGFVALATATAAVSGSLVAGAQGTPDRQRELVNQIGEASTSEVQAIQDLQAIQAKKADVDAKVADLDQQLREKEATLAPLQAEVDRIGAIVADFQGQIQVTQASLDAAQHEFDISAAELYRSARGGHGYDVILSSKPSDLVNQRAYLDRVSDQRRDLVAKVTGLRDDLDRQKRAVQVQQAKADAAAAVARHARDQVAALRAQLEPARAQAAKQQADEQTALDGIQARKIQFEAELASLQATSDGIAAMLRARGFRPGAIGRCQARPIPGGIGQPFGPSRDPFTGSSGFHPGVDMQGSSGTPIHACRGGEVVIAGGLGGYGNAVVIDHGGGMATLYGHQSSLNVRVGDQVSAGQVIGNVGSTGYSTGPHLHFEVRLSGNPVDPAGFL